MPSEEILARLTAPGAPFEIVEEEVLGERMPVFASRRRSLRELLAASEGLGEREYIVHGARRIGYAEHLRLVASTAAALRDGYGVSPGDRVAVLAANQPEWIVTFWACASLGATVAALNGWWTADEIRYGLEHSDPKLLVGDARRLARIADADPGVPVVEIESDFAKLLQHAPEAPLPSQPIAEDDPAVILYTSGTTGRPKGAVNTHRGICGFVQSAMLNAARLFLLAAERGETPDLAPQTTAALVTAPLFHVSGLYAGAVMMLASGAKTVWRSGRFDAEDVLRLIERERITSWSGMGNTSAAVLDHPRLGDYDISSLRNLGTGGAPTSPAVLERMKQVAPNGARARGLGYGLSEAVATVTLIGGEELETRPTSVGRVQRTFALEIRDPEGRVLPAGRTGEIHVRSPYTMLGYWRDEEATRRAIGPGRWLATGDMGHLDAEGYLYIDSRARDLILRGGENVYPVEIEHRLEAHPAVAEAAVVGIDHPVLGQEVKAIVVPKPGARLDPAELARFAGETLAPYKVPAHVELRDEPLPRNAAGKVMKHVLLGRAEGGFAEE